MQTAKTKKNNTSFLWILPLLALGMGLYLAYTHIIAQGPKITITFKNAEGLEADKTKIRFKELDIGTITELNLSADHTKVIAKAQMSHDAIPLLKEDSKLWVVKPRVSASGITGLNTLISGSYIALDPGKSQQSKEQFEALETPPLTPSSEAGIRIRLATQSTKGLNVGSPVYYRGFKVGQIELIEFDESFDRIFVDAFINSPYDRLINPNTKFWNASGIDVSVTAHGLDINMQSIETFALGGVSFSTPASLNNHPEQTLDNTIFTLYPSEQATTKPLFVNKQHYVMYFGDSIRGLSVGSNVELNGTKVGEVVDIRQLYSAAEGKVIAPVLVALESDQIQVVDSNLTNDPKTLFTTLIANAGLRASLENDSLITGSKYIQLGFYPKDKQKSVKDRYSDYVILPTISGGSLNRLTDDAQAILTKIKNLPIESLVGNADQAVKNANRILGSKEMQNLGKTVDRAVKNTSQKLDEALHGISPESSLYFNMQRTLESVRSMSNSIDRLMKKLDAKPNALILGD